MTDASLASLTAAERQRWGNVGLLAATALLLAYAETFVPIPLPGVKLGLANIAVLACLAEHDVAGGLCVALIKVLASGLLFGSPLTMAYSLAGTLLSFAGMAPLSRLRTMRLPMVSVVGALLHQVGQLAVASAILGSSVVWYLAPVLLAASCVTGAVCGVLAQQVATGIAEAEAPQGAGCPGAAPQADAPTSAGALSACPDAAAPLGEPCACAGGAHGPAGGRSLAWWLLIALVVLGIVVLRLQSISALAVLAAAVALAGPRSFVRLVPLLLAVGLLTLGLNYVAQPALAPAAAEAARSVLRLAILAGASREVMARVPTHDLTATLVWLLGPLTRHGVRTQGFVYAFDTAVRLLPTLGPLVRDRFARRDGASISSIVCDLVGQLWRA